MSLKKNTVWNLAGSIVPLIAAAIFIPYTLNHLGDEAFGVLTLIWALIGYFSLFDMGVGRALTYELSRLNSRTTSDQISPTLKGGIFITAIAGAIGAITMLLLAHQLATNWLKITPGLQLDAELSFKIAACGVMLTTISSGLRGALEGLQKFGASNINKLVLGFSTFTLPAMAIQFHGNQLSMIAAYLVAARLITTIGAVGQLWHYISAPGNALARSHLIVLIDYGFWVTISGIVGPLMVYGDRFFVSAAVGTAMLPLYAIPQEGLQRLLIIPGALCGALLPKLASLDTSEAGRLFRKSERRVAIFMLGITSLAVLLATPTLTFLISEKFATDAFPIVVILGFGIWINSIAFVPFALLHALRLPKLTAIFHCVELLIYAGTLWWLASQYGLIGAAVAWVLRVSLDLVLLQFAANRALRIDEAMPPIK